MVKVYSKNDCVQCEQTKRVLDKIGVEYTELNVESDNDAFEFVTSLNYASLPVVYVNEHDHWSGFRLERLRKLMVHHKVEKVLNANL